MTKVGRNLENIREEAKNQARFPIDGFGTDRQGFGTIFEELLPGQAPVEGSLVILQAFSVIPVVASVEYRLSWLKGEELLEFIHTEYKQRCTDTN